MIKIAICDDNINFINEIAKAIEEYSKTNNLLVSIERFDKGLELIDRYKQSNKYDIVFLDIDMPSISGREVVKELRAYDENFILIFITSLEEEIFKLVKYNIFRYIRKRYLKEELKEAYLAAIKIINERDLKYTFETKDGFFKISLSDILYFQLVDRRVELHDIKNINILKIKVFNDINEEFKSRGFISIYRGCLVNLRHIRRVGKKEIYLSNGEILQVSRIKIDEVTNSFFKYREDEYTL